MDFFYIDKIVGAYRLYSEGHSLSYSKKRRVHHLAYHFSGENVHIVNDKETPIATDTLLFLSKNDSYGFQCTSPTESISIEFLADTDMKSFTLDCSGNSKIKNLFQTIASRRNLDDKSNHFLSLSAMYELFNEIDKLQQKKYKSSAEKNKLYPAFTYIQEHYADEVITNVALAKMCNLSERRFITLFKDIYGDTPNQYILHKKISLAETLLSSKIYSIKQISEMCGFSDIYYFSKAFKKIMNTTPSDYRKNI